MFFDHGYSLIDGKYIRRYPNGRREYHESDLASRFELHGIVSGSKKSSESDVLEISNVKQD